MLRALQFTPGQGLREGGEELLQDYRPDSPGWLWVDLGGEDADEARRVLADNFRFSELAIADALRDRHPPKFEQFGDYTFLILRGLHPETTDINFQAITISFFVRPNLLVSRHALRSVSIDGLWKQIVTDKGRTVRHMWHAMYAVSRRIVDRYTNIMLAAEQRIELLEDEMFTSPGDELLAELINYNRNLRKIRRMSTYHQAVFKNLLAEDLPLESHDRHELADAKEHFDRIASLAALYQGIVGDLINGYLSLTSHRLNQIMKVLTIVTVIFMPLGLLAGIYGMNFENMPELGWQRGYFTILGVMAGVATTLLLVFRKLRWL